jgi:Ca2+-binding EF-hand superfamily protein
MLRRLQIACFLATAASLALAQGARERPRYVLQALDRDHDGALSAAEIAGAPAVLRGLDRNGDGELTADELQPPRTDPGTTPEDLEQQLMSLDRNGDGVLTADELPGRLQPIFARGDANHDGKLTPDEIRRMAEHTGAPAGRPGRVDGSLRADPVLYALDTDHDGTVSAGEIEAASRSLLTLDANHDGALSAGEMPLHQPSPAERAAHAMGEWDTDGDGKLSKAELPDALQARFEQADTDHNGFLTADELRAMFSNAPSNGDRNAGTEQKPQEPHN